MTQKLNGNCTAAEVKQKAHRVSVSYSLVQWQGNEGGWKYQMAAQPWDQQEQSLSRGSRLSYQTVSRGDKSQHISIRELVMVMRSRAPWEPDIYLWYIRRVQHTWTALLSDLQVRNDPSGVNTSSSPLPPLLWLAVDSSHPMRAKRTGWLSTTNHWLQQTPENNNIEC